jgi:RNA polymerase sigma factor (sigma-70 family)
MTKREEVIGKLRPKLVKFLVAHLGMGHDDSEDVAQESMLLLLTKVQYQHLEEEADLLPLGFQIARLKRLEFLKKSRRYGELPEDHESVSQDPDPLASLLVKDDESKARKWLQWLRDAIPRMEKRCRRLLEFRLQGLSTDEIAERMSMKGNYVLVAEHRCRGKLRSIQPEGGAR